MKQFYFFIFTFIFCNLIYSQNTYIPDLNFEQALSDLGIDTGPIDNYILTANLEAMEDDISIVEYRGITDITGIAAMTSIYGIIIKNNPIATIDFSGNPNLYYVTLENLNLTEVDLSNNVLIEDLKIIGMPSLANIDLSAQTNLKTLEIGGTLVSNLDLSAKAELTSVILANNQLTSLNAKNNNNSRIYSFNVTGNPNLECIQVDNQANAVAASGSYSTWLKDETASYSENCNTLNSNTFITKDIIVYPNPIKNNKIIQFNNIDSDFTFSLYDISGKLIDKKLINDNKYIISSLSKGIYLYTIQLENNTISNKLIVLD